MENLDYLNELRVKSSLTVQRGGTDIYHKKYLKYKEKYLELKNQSGGVITLKNGIHAYFTSEADAKKVCGGQFPGDAPSVANINKLLNGKGYYIKNGDIFLRKIKTTLTQVGTNLSNTGKNVASYASAASQVAIMRIKLASKALYGNLTAEIVQNKQDTLKTKLANMEKNRELYRTQKSKYTELHPGDHPDEIELEFAEEAQKRIFSALDEEYCKAIIQHLQKNGINVDTVLVVNLSSVGKNQCLSLTTYPNPFNTQLPASPHPEHAASTDPEHVASPHLEDTASPHLEHAASPHPEHIAESHPGSAPHSNKYFFTK